MFGKLRSRISWLTLLLFLVAGGRQVLSQTMPLGDFGGVAPPGNAQAPLRFPEDAVAPRADVAPTMQGQAGGFAAEPGTAASVYYTPQQYPPQHYPLQQQYGALQNDPVNQMHYPVNQVQYVEPILSATEQVNGEPALAGPGEPLPAPAGALNGDQRDEVERIIRRYLQHGDAEGPPASVSEWYEVGSDLDFHAYWNHGLEFATFHGDYRVHIGGRTQFDLGWFDTPPNVDVPTTLGGTGPFRDSAAFRRGRIRIDGTMHELLDFVAEYDFVGDLTTVDPTIAAAPSVTDLYVAFTNLPVVGNFRVGNFKDPIGFEHLTDSRWLNFMERSMGFDAFVGGFGNGFVPGLMIHHWRADERGTWWLGAFKNISNPFGYGVGSGEYAATTRLTMLPWYDAGGRYLLHLGSSVSHRGADDDMARYRARSAIRSGPPGPLNPVVVDTLAMGADSSDLFNVEMAAVAGSWTLQSEYTMVLTHDAVSPYAPPPTGISRGTAFFHAFYAEALCFLTGEHRVYDRRQAVFGRVIPHENFFHVPGQCGTASGLGAWQLGVRYDMLDLDDSGISGGTAYSITLGLNWFLNPNMKLQWNYDWTRRMSVGASSGDIWGAGVRMAMDF